MAATMQDYCAFIKVFGENAGLSDLKPEEGGLVSLSVEEKYELNLQFLEATGNILIFVEFAQLSPDTNREVYRELLAAGLFGSETAGGYFSLEPQTEAVVYNYVTRFDDANQNIDEFVQLIEKTLTLVDIWSERLKQIVEPSLEKEGQFEEAPSLFNSNLFA